jgi:hypothetical protein
MKPQLYIAILAAALSEAVRSMKIEPLGDIPIINILQKPLKRLTKGKKQRSCRKDNSFVVVVSKDHTKRLMRMGLYKKTHKQKRVLKKPKNVKRLPALSVIWATIDH